MAKKKVPNRQKTPPKKVKEPFKLSLRAKQGIIAGAVLLVLIITFFVVRYNMAALRLDADGKIINETGASFLVYNTKTKADPRYLKLGEIGPAEGYVLDKTDFLTDENESIYYYVPESGDEDAITYSVMVGKGDYKSIADTTVSSVPALLSEPVASEVTQKAVAGRNVAYYIYSGGSMNAETEGVIDYYTKQMNAYVEGRDGRCVVFMLQNRQDSAEGYPADADYEALLEKAVAELKL